MKKNKSEIFVLLLIIASFVIGVYLYPQFPEQVASHWNSIGESDGYISKFWGIFLMPIIMLVIFSLFLVFPKIAPLKKNIEKFSGYYKGFMVLMVIFFFYVYMLTISWNLGKQFNMSTMLIPAIGALFYYMGILIEKSKRNWFIGIRTPWTLSSDKVWEKTHRLGGKLFRIAGVLAFISVLFPKYTFFVAIIPIILASIFLIAYSYFVYKK